MSSRITEPEKLAPSPCPGFRPVAPVAPVPPVAPVAPVAPIVPVAPVAPVAPGGPIAPFLQHIFFLFNHDGTPNSQKLDCKLHFTCVSLSLSHSQLSYMAFLVFDIIYIYIYVY